MRFAAPVILGAVLVAIGPAASRAAAGDGLRHPHGFRDLCDACPAGTVPVALRRPLHLPVVHAGAACPASSGRRVAPGTARAAGRGPAYAVLGARARVWFEYPPSPESIYAGSAWSGNKVLWMVAPRYGGPLLIRGRRLDAAGRLGFSMGGPVAWDELQLSAVGTASASGFREWASAVRVRAAGCYGVQVDGVGFSYAIVLRAVRAGG